MREIFTEILNHLLELNQWFYIGAFFAAVSLVFVNIGAKSNLNILREQNDRLSDDLKSARSERDAFRSDLQEAREQLDVLRSGLNQARDERSKLVDQLLEANKSIVNLSTGGEEGYVYFVMNRLDDNTMRFIMVNPTDYVQYINAGRRWMVTETEKCSIIKEVDDITFIQRQCFENTVSHFTNITIGSEMSFRISGIDVRMPKESELHKIVVTWNARNGKFVQRIFFQNMGNGKFFFVGQLYKDDQIFKKQFNVHGEEVSEPTAWDKFVVKKYQFDQ